MIRKEDSGFVVKKGDAQLGGELRIDYWMGLCNDRDLVFPSIITISF